MAPESLIDSSPDGETIRSEFLKVLARRRSGAKGQLNVYPSEAPRTLPRASPEELPLPKLAPEEETKKLEEERLLLETEEGDDQGKVPLLILKGKPQRSPQVQKMPCLLILHSTNKSKDHSRPLIEHYALHGYISVGVDGRNHGQRASSPTAYEDALVSAWKTGEHMPFIFDMVWDLMRVMDYLVSRDDVDPNRIGLLGISLGGMITLYALAADTRFAAAVPLIGVQNFSWAVENNKWMARVGSIPRVFEVAAKDLGKPCVDSETVAAVWQKIAPGLMHKFDVPHILKAIVPRPLLVLNGKADPRCPLEGLEFCIVETYRMYEKAGYPEHFKFVAEEGVDHRITKAMLIEAERWFDKFL